MATATSISLLVYLTDIAKGLGGLEGLSGQLDALDEEAQNFLILGSDVRPGEGSRGRSDTTMLLRVDPDKGLISLLSIPRDLQVNIPGHGIDKFNAAYTYGGPKLTLQVVKQLTGQQVDINHVVNVDFNGFADAVNAIDCVYVDVDRHYLHSNVGLAATEQYAEIDIEAGYQRLCGYKALQYVRYRHEDNDIVRSARQQTFLREARQKVPPGKLLDDREQLIDIFKKYTTSDIEDVATLVQLFKLMLQARNAQINQIEFPFESLGDDAGYVTAEAAPIKAAVAEFLGKGVPAAPAAERGEQGRRRHAERRQVQRRQGEARAASRSRRPPPTIDMIDSTGSGQQYSTVLAQSAGKRDQVPDPTTRRSSRPARRSATRHPRVPDRRARRPDLPRLQVRDHLPRHHLPDLLLRRLGDRLAGRADLRQPQRREGDQRAHLQALLRRRQAAAWSASSAPTRSTGSRTPSTSCSRTSRCWRSPRTWRCRAASPPALRSAR